ncbi:MAG: hypothetical protein M1823_006130, partial [Watsoniomyces obsoletus]
MALTLFRPSMDYDWPSSSSGLSPQHPPSRGHPSSTSLATSPFGNPPAKELLSGAEEVQEILHAYRLVFLPQVRGLFCLRCTPLRPLFQDQPLRHLSNDHCVTEDLHLVEELLKQLPPLPRTGRDLRVPPPGEPALPHLPVDVGYRCVICPFASRSTKMLQNHWGDDHHDEVRPSITFRSAYMQTLNGPRGANHLFPV